MIDYLKWLVNKRAQMRPGLLGYTALALGAACIVPGIGMLFDAGGSVTNGLAMTAGSVAVIALGTLPAWKRQQQHERSLLGEAPSAVVTSEPSQQSPDPDAASGPDQYSHLRTSLKSSDQNRAVSQLNLLKQKMQDFESVLTLRFEPEELTTRRYRAAGERVFDGAIRNIESIDAFARSVRKVDESALLAQLDVLIAEGEGDSNAAMAIRERINMMTEANRHIAALLDSNEEALTSLTRVTTRLAAIATETSASTEAGDMASMIDDLDHLAERTERYSSRLKDQPSELLTPNG